MIDGKEYGRYIDEGDGLPRWELPPSSVHDGTRWRCMEEAIRELYPDYGARFTAERLGMPAKYRNITRYAALFGVKRTEARVRKGYEEMASRLKRIFKMERARVMGGLPQITRVNLGKGGMPQPQKLYSLRHKLVREYGYFYCDGDTEVLFYDDKTRRRLPGTVATNGFTEEEVTRRYGITFRRVDDDEGLDS